MRISVTLVCFAFLFAVACCFRVDAQPREFHIITSLSHSSFYNVILVQYKSMATRSYTTGYSTFEEGPSSVKGDFSQTR
jgi:hypothetical protein